MNKDMGDLLVVVLDKGEEEGKPCPLKGKDIKKCEVFQEKIKKAGIVCGEATCLVFTAVPRHSGESEPSNTIILGCQDRCPYLPTSKGEAT